MNCSKMGPAYFMNGALFQCNPVADAMKVNDVTFEKNWFNTFGCPADLGSLLSN